MLIHFCFCHYELMVMCDPHRVSVSAKETKGLVRGPFLGKSSGFRSPLTPPTTFKQAHTYNSKPGYQGRAQAYAGKGKKPQSGGKLPFNEINPFLPYRVTYCFLSLQVTTRAKNLPKNATLPKNNDQAATSGTGPLQHRSSPAGTTTYPGYAS